MISFKNPVRWLVVLFASVLILIGAAASAICWYQPSPPSSPTAITTVQISDNQNDINPVTLEPDDEEELILESIGHLLQPVALDVPVPIVIPAIGLWLPPVEQKPQPEPQLASIQPSTIIQLFGGLTWDDDLLTAFRKAMDFTGLEYKYKYIEVRINQSDGPVIFDEDSLPKALKNLNLLYTNRVVAIDKPVVQCEQITLRCSPVFLKHGSFRVDVVFRCEPGYTLDHARECLTQAKQIFGPDADFYLPLRLQKVSVTLWEHAKSSTLDYDAQKEIALQILDDLRLKHKYVLREHISFTMNNTEAIWQDRSRCRLRLLADPGMVQLTYEYNPSYFSELNQRLRKLQEEISEQIRKEVHIKKFTGSEDQSDKL